MGQPGRLKICHREEQTRGTETSKYPEEEKTIVIPQVVASERGIAQTSMLLCRGVVGLTERRLSEVEGVWKTPPKRVKAPYTN